MTGAAFAALGLAAVSGCGNNYRPVVTAIAPVGPAGQPTKYAIAISSASSTANGLVTTVDFSGDTVLNTTLIGLNPYYFILGNSGSTGFTLNSDGTLNSFSTTSPTTLLSSDVLQGTLLPNSAPAAILPLGTTTFITETGRNAIGQATGSPPAIVQELPTPAAPIYTVGVAGAVRVYALAPGLSSTANGTATAIDAGTNTITATFAVGANPTYGVMTADGRRAFILNKNSANVTVINAQSNLLDTFNTGATTSSTIPVGVAPVWADFAPSLNELFVVNQGPAEFGITSYSIANNVATFQTSAQTLTAGQQLTLLNFPASTFFNGQTVTVSATGLSTNSFQVPLTHANVASLTEAGNAVGNGSVTVVNIPLCVQNTVTTNPSCDAANPIDAVGFGTVIATIPVGPHPVMIGVMQDATQAFVANQGVLATGTTPGTPGSVSVINIPTFTVIANVPAINQSVSTENDAYVHGHPNYIGVTTGSPTGKAYVVASDSTDISIIRSDIDTIQTHLSLQGYGISVRMTQP